jgi:hypothetical protein
LACFARKEEEGDEIRTSTPIYSLPMLAHIPLVVSFLGLLTIIFLFYGVLKREGKCTMDDRLQARNIKRVAAGGRETALMRKIAHIEQGIIVG